MMYLFNLLVWAHSVRTWHVGTKVYRGSVGDDFYNWIVRGMLEPLTTYLTVTGSLWRGGGGRQGGFGTMAVCGTKELGESSRLGKGDVESQVGANKKDED